MLCFIFTRKKLLVGVKGRITEFLRFDGKSHLDFAGRRAHEVFEAHFTSMVDTYLDYAQRNHLKLGHLIPVALAFPAETYQAQREDALIAPIIHRIEETVEPLFQVVHHEPLHHAYLRGLPGSLDALNEPCALVEGVDGFPALIYLYQPEDGLEGSQLVPIPRVGVPGSSQSLLQALEVEFGKFGLNLDLNDRNKLLEQIRQYPPVEHFKLFKSVGASRLNLEVPRKALVMDDPMASYRQQFDEWMDRKKLEALGIQRVHLLGSSLQKGHIHDYLASQLQLKDLLLQAHQAGQAPHWKTIVRGMITRMQQLNSTAALNGHGQAQRHEQGHDFAESSPSLSSHKPGHFSLPLGEARDQQAMDHQALDDASTEASGTHPPHEPQPAQEPTAQKTIPQETAWLGRLGFPLGEEANHHYAADEHTSVFQPFVEVKGIPEMEFHSFRVIDKLNQRKKILRFISREEMENAYLKDQFFHLYEKERTFYGLTTKPQPSAEGLYYLRDFIKGERLYDYAKKHEWGQKQRLDDFSSKDLQLMLSILEAVTELQIPHTRLNAHNILLISGLKWNLQHTFHITFIGFTAEDCSREDMRQRIHRTLDDLLWPGVFDQIRQGLHIS